MFVFPRDFVVPFSGIRAKRFFLIHAVSATNSFLLILRFGINMLFFSFSSTQSPSSNSSSWASRHKLRQLKPAPCHLACPVAVSSAWIFCGEAQNTSKTRNKVFCALLQNGLMLFLRGFPALFHPIASFPHFLTWRTQNRFNEIAL